MVLHVASFEIYWLLLIGPIEKYTVFNLTGLSADTRVSYGRTKSRKCTKYNNNKPGFNTFRRKRLNACFRSFNPDV